jgi:TRAP-type C4-dicarboxylate transport system permease small subunit
MDTFLAASARIKKTIEYVLGGIAAVMLLVLTIFSLVEIVRRYIFGVVFPWGQDAIVVGMVSAVAFYIGVTQIRRSHLVMNALTHYIHARGNLMIIGLLNIIVSAIVVVFCAAIGITGWSSFEYAWNRDLKSYSLVIPLWPFFLIMIFGFLTMAFVAFLQLIEDIISFSRKEYLDNEIQETTDV